MAEIRIVAGTLRTRKIVCQSTVQLRPTPHRVRESLFNILADSIPDRPFIDVFAGSGVNGFEALSRGASSAIFIERDSRLIRDIKHHLELFDMSEKGIVTKTDVYRWLKKWDAPQTPVNVFISPPFKDLQERTDAFLLLLNDFQSKIPPLSIVVVQSEAQSAVEGCPQLSDWQERRYGRNVLLIWRAPAETPSS